MLVPAAFEGKSVRDGTSGKKVILRTVYSKFTMLALWMQYLLFPIYLKLIKKGG